MTNDPGPAKPPAFQRRVVRVLATGALLLGLAGSIAAHPVAASGAPESPSAASSQPSGGVSLGGDGSVETIVGPGVCRGLGQLDETSVEVRTLAVGEEGRLFVDTGRPEVGRVARVDEYVQTGFIPTGITDPRPTPLAHDGAGGLLVAAESYVAHLGSGGASVTVAGDRVEGTSPRASGDGGPATDARFAGIRSLAADRDGNVYVADALEADADLVAVRFVNRSDEPVAFYAGTAHERTVAPGHIDTIAGVSGPKPGAGEGGPAVAATLAGHTPSLAVHGDRLYVGSYTAGPSPTSGVRLVNLGSAPLEAHGVEVRAGAIETVAGGNLAGYRGEGELALDAQFGRLTGLAADDDGHLYVADTAHHRVRRIDAAGAVSTFAGTGPVAAPGGFNGNGRLVTDARLDTPHDVAVAPDDGRVFIADRGNGQVRVVDDDGVIYAAPGNGIGRGWLCEDGEGELSPAYEGDALVLDAAPADVTADGQDTYFTVASSYATNPLPVIYRRDHTGRVEPVMGSIGAASCPDADGCDGAEVPLDDAPLGQPVAVAVNRSGGLYVLDQADGGILWLANVGRGPLTAHDVSLAPGKARTLPVEITLETAPSRVSIEADPQGNLYVVDDRRMRRYDEAGGQILRLDADGELAPFVQPLSEDELTGGENRFVPERCCARPRGLAVDDHGNVYVTDVLSGQIWLFNQQEEAISAHGERVPAGEARVVAGAPRHRFYGDPGDGGDAVDSELRAPAGLAVDSHGNLYVIDDGEHTVRGINADGDIATVAGTGGQGFNGDGLDARLTTLEFPTDIATDACGNLLIADSFSQRLRRADFAGGCHKMAAGSGEESRWSGGSLAVAATVFVAAIALGVMAGRLRAWRVSRA